jgi:high-affinity iron transporter
MVRATAAGALALAALMLALPGTAGAAHGAPGSAAVLLDGLAGRYRQAVVVHDEALASRLRVETTLLARARPADPAARRLATTVAATRDALHPWPTADAVARLARRAGAALPSPTPVAPRPYDALRRALDRAAATARSGARAAALDEALEAYALAQPVLRRLGSSPGGLEDALLATDPARPGLLAEVARGAPGPSVAAAADRARQQVSPAEQALGDVRISHATVLTDAAILVFREGLEAVLILAAITASFVGARRHLRRPVLLGGIAGIGATAITWGAVQLLVSELGTGGLRLEAITGLLAIAVLLLVTNWFFHRVYWSQWIARFNRRRKGLERFDRLGFVSGQVLALGVLGLTSVYREGFETVLFLQNLQVSAGTTTCLLGAAIGLAATLGVGLVTFVAQRKLPYRKMLIATGVLIALVLAVMTGTTIHVLQGLGWLPSTSTGFTLPIWANSWLGLYATWQGLAAQAGALLVVLGSYVVAREIQVRRPRRRARRRSALAATQSGA